MRMGPLILLAGTLAFVAWIAPHLPVPEGSPAPVTAGPAADSAPQARQKEPGWAGDGTVLERAGDGHFYVDASVEYRSTRFLVDTGASIIVLTGSDARAIGLDWNDSDLAPIGRGAGGTVYGVRVRLERVELGGIEVHDVDAAIIPQGLDVSLLGQSFLTRLSGVRIEGDRMILGGDS
ncbi:retropepsin-like aspartic protease family protein [Novosphingobium album (ex Hu et al. 2023)]|uniref:TIGR02281 family clan AA aspartic protease n=1 Tax=Novosphingobium album (ex Hu et al. 2023) TaxID=2930093 RepID=A0ABT0B683_9SPHN|nr:TIGR02281 family clan AA aspartic protease [Novosphingobium album (ex Hu et al. 2023)]MCJ2180414.1 TIGR02281 family clan AA aspartic protease [Novosphingobium album (ex Hu et al. 2023)]